jgi:hypothetical protein
LKRPFTIKDLMLIVAIVGLLLGIAINTMHFLPLILIGMLVILPQVLVLGICALIAIRDKRA